MEEWIVVKNTPEKNNPLSAIPKKIVILDGSKNAMNTFVEELIANGEMAYKRQSYLKYFNIKNLPREYYQTINDKENEDSHLSKDKRNDDIEK